MERSTYYASLAGWGPADRLPLPRWFWPWLKDQVLSVCCETGREPWGELTGRSSIESDGARYMWTLYQGQNTVSVGSRSVPLSRSGIRHLSRSDYPGCPVCQCFLDDRGWCELCGLGWRIEDGQVRMFVEETVADLEVRAVSGGYEARVHRSLEPVR